MGRRRITSLSGLLWRPDLLAVLSLPIVCQSAGSIEGPRVMMGLVKLTKIP